MDAEGVSGAVCLVLGFGLIASFFSFTGLAGMLLLRDVPKTFLRLKAEGILWDKRQQRFFGQTTQLKQWRGTDMGMKHTVTAYYTWNSEDIP